MPEGKLFRVPGEQKRANPALRAAAARQDVACRLSFRGQPAKSSGDFARQLAYSARSAGSMLARAWDVDSALGSGAERFGEIGRQVLNADTGPSSAHLAVLNGLLHHGRRHCNRHRQVDTDTCHRQAR